MSRVPPTILRPVKDLSGPTAPPPPALELVAHDATVSMGDLGPNICLVFDLMAPGLGSPMLIRITVPLLDRFAARKIGEGIIRKVDGIEPENHHDA